VTDLEKLNAAIEREIRHLDGKTLYGSDADDAKVVLLLNRLVKDAMKTEPQKASQGGDAK